MPSKSETARANGAKSRGPATAAGKRKSSRNSLSHGFTSRSTIILEYENPEEFQQMLTDYHATYEPVTPAEKDLVDQMVSARWRIRRLWTIETALLDTEITRRQAEVERDHPDADGGVELALAFKSLADDSRALHLISRYESRLYRMHDRAYTALRELQSKNCKTNPTHPAPQIPEQIPQQPSPQIQQQLSPRNQPQTPATVAQADSLPVPTLTFPPIPLSPSSPLQILRKNRSSNQESSNNQFHVPTINRQ